MNNKKANTLKLPRIYNNTFSSPPDRSSQKLNLLNEILKNKAEQEIVSFKAQNLKTLCIASFWLFDSGISNIDNIKSNSLWD
jgi:hypothetical protein